MGVGRNIRQQTRLRVSVIAHQIIVRCDMHALNGATERPVRMVNQHTVGAGERGSRKPGIERGIA